MALPISASYHSFTKPHLSHSLNPPRLSKFSIPLSTNFPVLNFPLKNSSKKIPSWYCSKSSEEAQVSDQWLQRLPDRKKPLYSHSLPCIESWLKSLDFCQSKEDRALWFVQHPHWHAQLSLDITDLYIRYLKSGPGGLEKDVERRFSYALSREDIENAILGGP